VTRGERARELMNKSGVSVNEMADYIGKSAQYVSNILADRIKEPTWETRKLMAKRLNVTIDYLEEGVDEDKIYYSDPDVLKHLPKEMQDFVLTPGVDPYLLVAMFVKRSDLKNLSEIERNLFIEQLQNIIDKNKSTNNI
jgi:transcriptional regulator with XRE-family HTH domain